MKIEQIYTGCLPQAAYYIESDGQAAIIDPYCDAEQYIQKANEDNAVIKYLFKTHCLPGVVPDFSELAQITGAQIIYGPSNSEPDITIAYDGQVFSLGKSKITVLSTPGHKKGKTSYLLNDEIASNVGVFYGRVEKMIDRPTHALDSADFETLAKEVGVLVLDTRDANEFAKGHIPNSVNIGIDGNIVPWIGSLIPDIHKELLLVMDHGREDEVITRLARIGYDSTIGYLIGGFRTWKNSGKEIDKIVSISADEFFEIRKVKTSHI